MRSVWAQPEVQIYRARCIPLQLPVKPRCVVMSSEPPRVSCYAQSVYLNDLHLQTQAEAWPHRQAPRGGEMLLERAFVRPDPPRIAGGLPPGMAPSQLSPNQLAYANAQVRHCKCATYGRYYTADVGSENGVEA